MHGNIIRVRMPPPYLTQKCRVCPASRFNLKNETSDFEIAIFCEGIKRSPKFLPEPS